MLAHRLLARFAILVLSLVSAASSLAADLEVSYLVDARVFRRSATADTSLVVTVYRDRDCTTPATGRSLTAGDLDVIEKLRRLPLRSASPPPETARLTAVLRDLDASDPAFVILAGTGISPVGGACQAARVLGPGQPGGCAPDAAALGPICVDKYEGSVWRVPAARPDIVAQIKAGTITQAALVAAGATQIHPASPAGCSFEEYGPTFTLEGNYTEPLYAVSIPGVLPSNCLTARQATAACALAGKRLLTGSEWYHAQVGTPPPVADDLVNDCAVGSPAPVATGSRSACVSTIGVHDMIGNLYEWTEVFATTLDIEGRSWITGHAFGVGTGNPIYPVPGHLSGPIAVHTDTGFRCGR